MVARLDEFLGPDLLDDDARSAISDRAFDRAAEYADQLTGPNPNVAHRAAGHLQTLVDLNDPADAATPLGVAIASTEGFEGQLISQAAAADLLRVSRQRVNDLIRAKRLEGVAKMKNGRQVTQRVTRASIAKELGLRIKKPVHLVERIDRSGRGLAMYLTDMGGWATIAEARAFPTLREAERVASGSPGGVFARGIDVHLFGGQGSTP